MRVIPLSAMLIPLSFLLVLAGDKAYVSNWAAVSRTTTVSPGRPARARGCESTRCVTLPMKVRFP
jgi:hypothetical protein